MASERPPPMAPFPLATDLGAPLAGRPQVRPMGLGRRELRARLAAIRGGSTLWIGPSEQPEHADEERAANLLQRSASQAVHPYMKTGPLFDATYLALTKRRWAEARALLDELGRQPEVPAPLPHISSFDTGPRPLSADYRQLLQDRIDLVNAKVPQLGDPEGD